jgi:hypothetical protein
MLKSIARKVGSGEKKFNVTINFEGVADEQIQQDAMSFYVWKIQRTIREASDEDKAKMFEDGITLHATEVGKPVVSTEQIVAKMTIDQAEKAIALLTAKLAARK